MQFKKRILESLFYKGLVMYLPFYRLQTIVFERAAMIVYQPTRQDVHGRWADDLLWARMKVFRTSLFVADVENTWHRRCVRFGRTNYVLRTPGRKRTSEKCSYGPKLGRPLKVAFERDVLWTNLAEWERFEFSMKNTLESRSWSGKKLEKPFNCVHNGTMVVNHIGWCSTYSHPARLSRMLINFSI